MEELFLNLEGAENRRQDPNRVLAFKTKLGWTIAGPLDAVAEPVSYHCNVKVINAIMVISAVDGGKTAADASTVADEENLNVAIAVKLRLLNNVDAIGIDSKKLC